jgi:hypothetical protein
MGKKKWPKICLHNKITRIHTYNINYYSQVELDENPKGKQRVCHTVALPFTLKLILRPKEELWKLKYFTMQKEKNPNLHKKIL